VRYWPREECREGQGLAERWADMRDRGLTLDHAIGDAVHLLHIWGLGQFGIDASLEDGELPAIQSIAYRASVNQSVPHGVPAGGISVEGHRRDMYKKPNGPAAWHLKGG
jgi:hypothetical protein